uniref:RING-type domain-containing protein n=1 Tax=Arcella intermedia TaxID=1963864 RepID=A0A6B2L280_9EUKA
MKQELNCPLCLHLFEDPRVLPCAHTFCRECLFGAFSNWESLCPVCRKPTNLNQSHVNNLPKNYHVANIVDRLNSSQRETLHLVRPEPVAVSSPTLITMNPAVPVPILPSPAQLESNPQKLFASFVQSASAPPADDHLPLSPPPPQPVRSPVPIPSPAPVPPPPSIPPSLPSSGLYPSLDYDIDMDMDLINQPEDIDLDILKQVEEEEKRRNTQKGLKREPFQPDQPDQLYQAQFGIFPVNVREVNFSIGYNEVNIMFNQWKSSLWLTPRSFRNTAKLISVDEILVPHWLFDVRCTMKMTGLINKLTYNKSTETDSFEWVLFSEQKSASYDDLFVLGIDETERSYQILQECVKHWEIPTLFQKASSSSYGWGILETLKNKIIGTAPQTKKTTTERLTPIHWKKAFDKYARATVCQRELENAPQYMEKMTGESLYKDIAVDINSLSDDFKRILVFVPFYLCTYQFQDSVYIFAVTGKEGRAEGERPYGLLGNLLNGASNYIWDSWWTANK